MNPLGRMLDPLHRRIMLAIGRAVLRAAATTGGLQITLLADETRDNVEHVQPYGLSTLPLGGAEAVVLSVGGNRDHPLAVVVDDPRHRPSGLAAGEVCLHAAAPATQRIHLLADGSILIIAPLLRIETAMVEVIGGDVVAEGISLRNHTHGGVEPGGGSTGAPA
jgi:phage baseplate assembly protein V